MKYFLSSTSLRWLATCALLLLIPSLVHAHPAHETNAEMTWNASRHAFEVALKIRGVDLEQTLSIDGQRIDLERTDRIDDHIAKYLTDNFLLKTAEAAELRISFVGKEIDDRTAWLFFEFELPENVPPSTCTITNRILFDVLPGQVNKVDLRIGDARNMLLFDKRNPTAELAGIGSNMSKTSKWTPPLSLASLPANSKLPDLFTLSDGSRVKNLTQWETRRGEIKDMIQYFEYGHVPPRPDTVSGTIERKQPYRDDLGTEERILLSIGSKENLAMHIAIHLPTASEPKRFPVIVSEVHRITDLPCIELFLKNGFAFAQFERDDLDPDMPEVIGPAQAAYPDHDWATLAVWAWGASRVVDYLESRNDIDLERIGITGHSRDGKAALLAGALDERFALVAPNGSGCGGAGCFRGTSQENESLAKITDPKRFGYWFHSRFRWFADQEARLPFDQHFVKALVAPRALLCTEARGDLWANPVGTRRTSIAARDVFSFLDASEKIGLCYREGKHDQTMQDWQSLLDFAQWHFYDQVPEEQVPKDRPAFWQSP